MVVLGEKSKKIIKKTIYFLDEMCYNINSEREVNKDEKKL